MTCEEFGRLEARYLAGATSEVESLAVEAHASECEECGARLEASTRRDVASFSPALPPELRARTLAAVAQRHVKHTRTLKLQLGGFAAAAAIVAIVLMNAPTLQKSAQQAPSVAVTTTELATTPTTLATRSSRGEFEALDEAAREIQTELAKAPEDPELRQFLASIIARRAELERRVKDAS
jgi:hypothetical protein